MKRVSDPEIRKRQILETAMRLFYENGYDDTSLEDIAKELHVVKSLCYRYFDSKQKLFAAVMDEYTEECCRDFVIIIRNREKGICDRLRQLLERLLKPSENGRYHDFFHKAGNESMHDELAVKMCRYMLPCFAGELEYSAKHEGLACGEPKVTAQFLLYGLIGVWQESGGDDDARIAQFCDMAERVLGAAEEKHNGAKNK